MFVAEVSLPVTEKRPLLEANLTRICLLIKALWFQMVNSIIERVRFDTHSSTVIRSRSFSTVVGGYLMFKVGDNAVYPAHGVAIIKRIEEKEVGGKKKKFYVLQVVDNLMTIMVPTDNVASVGLREIISTKDVNTVYDILRERNVKIDQTTWNRRYREYMEKIKTGSIFEIAEVLRNLFMLRHSKDLSFGERKMLDQAKHLLVKEISLAKQLKEEVIEQEIQTIFAS